MKKLLGIVVLGLLLNFNVNADNISEFELDGMSIGESALKYFSKSEIKKYRAMIPKSFFIEGILALCRVCVEITNNCI